MNGPKSVLRKFAPYLVVGLFAAVAGCGGDDNNDTPAPVPVVTSTVATWTGSPMDYREDLTGFGLPLPTISNYTNQTVRNIVHIGVGGDALRIKLSNRYGTVPVVVDKIRAALSVGGAAIDPATDTSVTFGGATTVTLPAGGEVQSDTIALRVDQRANVAVSMYFVNSPITTFHRFATSTNYVNTGDVTSASANTTATASQIGTVPLLSEVAVVRSGTANVVVAFGDSLTDGTASTANANTRYPNQLYNRLNPTTTRTGTISVVNEGIAGNRWIFDIIGEKGTTRFARDALAVTGVTHVIIYLGINDINGNVRNPAQAVTAAQIIAADTAAVTAAKAAKLKVYLATLTPYNAISADNEVKRQTVNTFIRTQTIADGVIDFDAAVRDPANPARITAAYDSGDGLHFNDLGYGVLAATPNAAFFQ